MRSWQPLQIKAFAVVLIMAFDSGEHTRKIEAVSGYPIYRRVFELVEMLLFRRALKAEHRHIAVALGRQFERAAFKRIQQASTKRP